MTSRLNRQLQNYQKIEQRNCWTRLKCDGSTNKSLNSVRRNTLTCRHEKAIWNNRHIQNQRTTSRRSRTWWLILRNETQSGSKTRVIISLRKMISKLLSTPTQKQFKMTKISSKLTSTELPASSWFEDHKKRSRTVRRLTMLSSNSKIQKKKTRSIKK